MRLVLPCSASHYRRPGGRFISALYNDTVWQSSSRTRCLRIHCPSEIQSKQIGAIGRVFSVGDRKTSVRAKATVAAGQEGMDPWIIVGNGRVGAAFADMGDGNDVVVKRGEAIVPDGEVKKGPIVVCTRNDDLESIVEGTPADRREDLVFIQNGMLQPWLETKGLGENTQVLVYFAVAKKGEAPTDGKTDTNPEGLTAAYGKHADAIASRLHAAGLSCKVLPKTEFQQSMLEKLVWICSFMLIGAKHGGCTVGEVESTHTEEVSNLIKELYVAGCGDLGIPVNAGELQGMVERLNAYARSVSHFPTAVKEFPWRNGYFHGLSSTAVANGDADPCPLHSSLLQEVGAV
ncbi:hypothetical protein M9434_006065 [Picochlorum sp. BPE23]|nr:hypothetical protein M9434_006065 [Picochlorum sp. BPE23]